MAVFRQPPVAQFQQPRAYADVRTVDSPIPRPPGQIPLVEWLRRRHDYECELQQPRRLLDVSVTQSVDSPIPRPAGQVPQVEWLRRRADYEAHQPLRLLDVSFVQSVDSPPIPALPTVEWLRRRSDFEADQQPRRLLDLSVTQSVDSPPIALTGQWTPTAKRVAGQQLVPLPVDITSPPPAAYIGPPIQQLMAAPRYQWEAWAQGEKLDTSYTMSVDSPPLPLAGQWMPTAKRVAGQQAVPLPVEITSPAVVYLSPPVVPLIPTPRYPWEPWLQAKKIDTSYSMSVDSPPGIVRRQLFPQARIPTWVPRQRPIVLIPEPPPAGPTLNPPLSTTFLSDGSTLTSFANAGTVATVNSDDLRRTTEFLLDGREWTENLNP